MSSVENTLEVRLLLSHLDELETVFKRVDLPKLLDQLCQFYIVEKQTRSVFNTMDERVDLSLKVRYLVQHICDQVRQNSELFSALLKVFESSKEMVSLSKILSKKYNSGEADSNKELGQILDTGKLLTEDDLPDLTNDLASVAYKWKEIGIGLRVPRATLQDIKNEDSCKAKLYEILHVWIIEGTSLKPVTLKKLKEILKSPLVELLDIADKLCCEDTPPASKRPCLDNAQFCHPRILCQSLDIEVSYGKNTLLEIQVTSNKPVSYQWTKDGQPLSDDTSYQGTSSIILLVSHRNMASKHIEGRYVCEVEGIGKSREISVIIEYPVSIQHLLNRYSSLREVPEDSWPQAKIESFVELAIINKTKSDDLKELGYSVRGDMDDILFRKENIKYEECFGKYESRTLLVVEGRPGVGKTTLAHKVTRDWSTGENVLVGADLVFLVSLRLLNVNKTNSIFELLGFNSHKSDKDKIKGFESQKGLQCCFVLDGLDEYQSYNYNEVNFVYDLIRKEIAKAMVIVFSRPVGKIKLKKCKAEVDRRIEILGFKSDQISDYINTYFQQDSKKAEKLMKYLEKHINVLHMCYLPVHVTMICYIHSQYEDSNILNTETQIYEHFAMLTIVRKLRRECGSEVSNQPTSFESLNDKDKNFLNKICKLAFDMCLDQRQVFERSNNEIMLSDELDSDEPSLGLVTVDSTAKLYNFHDIYAFLHLTFQEYLAAYHIFSLPSDQQLIIDQHKDNEAMLVVWKFYCGMMGQNGQLLKHVQTLFSSKHADTLYRVHCAFESQQSAVCDAVINHGQQQNSLSFKKKVFTPGDYNAITYVMSEASGPTSKLAFYSCRLQENGVKQLIETIQQVNVFVFHSPNPAVEQFECVNSLLGRMESLEVLDLYDTMLCEYSMIQLAKNVILPHLKCIKIKVQVPGHFIENYFQCLTFNSKPETVHCHMIGGKDFYDKALKYTFSSSIIIKYEESLKQYVAYLSNLKLAKTLNLNVFAHCSTFCFVNCSINDHKIIALSESLNYSNSIKKLVFDFNEICQGAVALVSRCAKLKHLSIRCNSIDDEGAKSLAGAVRECTDLVHLDLEYNCFGDEGAIAIASAVSHLSIDLYLWNANITGKGVTSVLNYVSSANIHSPLICDFEEVNLQDPDCLYRAIQCCTSIAGVKLCHSHLSENSAKLLRLLKNLEQLCILTDFFKRGKTSLLPVLFDLMKSFTNLRILDTSQSNIGSEVAAALADGLKSCTNLETLNIGYNSIDSKGVATLANGLESCTNLRKIDISSNLVYSEGAAALGNRLKSYTYLQTLDISGNSIGSEGAAALADGLKSCTNLQTLNISRNNIYSFGAAALADGLKSCTNLQTLSIGYNSIDVKGTTALVNGLKSCSILQRIDISFNHIGPEGAAALADGLKSYINLQTLDISENNFDSSGAAALAGGLKYCTNLRTLNISKNIIGSEGAAALADSLKSCTGLQTLDISVNIIGSEGAAALADGLKFYTDLQTLNISGNSIDSEGAAALAVGLKSFSNLQTLCTGNNGIGLEGAAALIKSCTNLQTLYMCRNSVGLKEAAAAADGLIMSCTNLQTLDISHSYIGSEGAAVLAGILKFCTNLLTLDISHNSIGSEGAAALADSLKSCTNLQTLNISWNHIGSEGEAVLADLKSCTSLVRLDISNNSPYVCLEGVAPLTEGLESCTDIGLNRNYIRWRGSIN